MKLREASLSSIAVELRRRAARTCSHCGGYGYQRRSESSTSVDHTGCPSCKGTGYEKWPELLALAKRLEQLVEGEA